MSSTSVFCGHKRLRTTCPDCKEAARPPPPSEATRVPAPSERDAEPKEPRKKSGQLLPSKRRQRSPTSRAEAEQAEAWWVRRG